MYSIIGAPQILATPFEYLPWPHFLHILDHYWICLLSISERNQFADQNVYVKPPMNHDCWNQIYPESHDL